MTNSRNILSARNGIGWLNRVRKTNDLANSLNAVKHGLPFQALKRFEKESGLPTSTITRILRLPRRTLSRRKTAGKLSGLESERLMRLVGLYQKALDLFEGNAAAARNWLSSRNRALGRRTPLTLAETEQGARVVEDLIGRLEYGVYS
jgi:putative toxin-antitoxin system antitoxin component (TIGR02293 family)